MIWLMIFPDIHAQHLWMPTRIFLFIHTQLNSHKPPTLSFLLPISNICIYATHKSINLLGPKVQNKSTKCEINQMIMDPIINMILVHLESALHLVNSYWHSFWKNITDDNSMTKICGCPLEYLYLFMHNKIPITHQHPHSSSLSLPYPAILQ